MATSYKILVPMDLSESSMAGLDIVLAEPVFTDAAIYVLYVVDNVPLMAFHTVDVTAETVLRDLKEKARTDLDEFLRPHALSGRAFRRIIRSGEAHKEIVRCAREEKIDLIVMATHGRTGLAHILLGSVAEKVVRYSPLPVLTVKPTWMRESLLKMEDVEEQLHMKTQAND